MEVNREECICGERDSPGVKGLIVNDISNSSNLGSGNGLLHSLLGGGLFFILLSSFFVLILVALNIFALLGAGDGSFIILVSVSNGDIAVGVVFEFFISAGFGGKGNDEEGRLGHELAVLLLGQYQKPQLPQFIRATTASW